MTAQFLDAIFVKDFPTFARKCHEICYGGQTLDTDPYLDVVLANAEQIANGKILKAVVNMPPGTGKSFIHAVVLPAWILGHDPTARILIVEHSKKLSRDAARNIRKIL